MDWMIKPKDVQGGAAWHEWRSKGIGASEASIIMECNPWTTKFQLWQQKTGQKAPEPAGFAAQRGNRLEPVVRKKVEAELGIKFPAETMEKDDTIFRASLDGWNEETKTAIEIKCTGQKTHDEAKENNQAPEHYWWQIQHQYFVTDAKQILYVSYYLPMDSDDDEAGELVVFPVERDDDAIEKYIAKAKDFWKLVESVQPPEMSDKDTVETDDEHLKRLLEKYSEHQFEMNLAKSKVENARKEILDHVKSKNWMRVRCSNALIFQTTRKGSVDWSKVPETKGIDVEKYRKKGTISWTIKLD